MNRKRRGGKGGTRTVLYTSQDGNEREQTCLLRLPAQQQITRDANEFAPLPRRLMEITKLFYLLRKRK